MKNNSKYNFNEPLFGSKAEDRSLPSKKLNKETIPQELAYELLKDELLDEGNARLNLATFCQTYMEDKAIQIMSETLEKNAIDKTEYPQTSDIEQRCINIIADLWNTPKGCDYIGSSTVGSSEASMLAGLALKFAWRKQAQKFNINTSKQKPNLVISSGYQVCWEKFATYWDIELRIIPMDEKNLSVNPKVLDNYLDEYTIGVVGILGITYTGQFDKIEKLDSVLEKYNKKHDIKVYLHVDAASGGMFAPFVNPELKWDFRLKNVISINTSSHKYGLVYPGLGWVIWKDRKYLDESLIFEVSYLGGKMPTIAINFSRSASQIIGQYYNFLRYGFNGYQQIHQRTKDVALYISKEVNKSKYFEIVHGGEDLPVICWKLKNEEKTSWTLYDLADRLQMNGWQVPVYPLPNDLEDIIVQRVVCRADFGMPLAEQFIIDFNHAIKALEEAHILFHKKGIRKKYGFTH